MYELEHGRYQALYERYKSSEPFFPLIGAVLLKQQDGVVYVDDPTTPQQAYVEHAFGFAQMFGQKVATFESALERYLLVERRFAVPKVRFYATYLPDFLGSPRCNDMRSVRQRFSITPERFAGHRSGGSLPTEALKAVIVNAHNIAEVERLFGVTTRFWRSPEDFIGKANAVAVLSHGSMAGVCYAAAEAGRRVEIDVLTLPEFRKLGVGRFAVTQFVERCFSRSLQPVWDCFTNNAGSMNLSRAVGFTAASDPYPFFTINKS